MATQRMFLSPRPTPTEQAAREWAQTIDALCIPIATLRGLRERAGLPQWAVAHVLDVNASTLAHWERGTYEPPRTSWLAWSEAIRRIATDLELEEVDR